MLRRIPHWNFLSKLFYLLSRLFFFLHYKIQQIFSIKRFKQGDVYNFNGALLPSDLNNKQKNVLFSIMEDSFFVSLFLKDDYSKENVEFADNVCLEGPYCYKDGYFDVTIKKDDVILDAGAYIGDFGAYAATKDAITYSFEPSTENYNVLVKTAKLNGNKLIPIKMGLGDKTTKMVLSTNLDVGNLILTEDNTNLATQTEEIEVITIDDFVKNNNLQKVDFIKADIEGYERFMLEGARETLKKFGPKLAICTYHLDDDRQYLEKLIKGINPKYEVRHLKNKLFACVTA